MTNELIIPRTQNPKLNSLAKKPPLACVNPKSASGLLLKSQLNSSTKSPTLSTSTSTSTSNNLTTTSNSHNKRGPSSNATTSTSNDRVVINTTSCRPVSRIPIKSGISSSSDNEHTVLDIKSSHHFNNLADIYLNYALNQQQQQQQIPQRDPQLATSRVVKNYYDQKHDTSTGITSSSAYFFNDRPPTQRASPAAADLPPTASSLLVYDKKTTKNSSCSSNLMTSKSAVNINNNHMNQSELYQNIDYVNTNIIECINKSIDFCGGDYNSLNEDIISLNVDFEDEDEEHRDATGKTMKKNVELAKKSPPQQKQPQQQQQQSQTRTINTNANTITNNAVKFKSNSLLDLASKSQNVFSNPSLDTFNVLNPKKYTLELSTLSSSISASSSESIQSCLTDENSSNRSSLDCYDDFCPITVTSGSNTNYKACRSTSEQQQARVPMQTGCEGNKKERLKQQQQQQQQPPALPPPPPPPPPPKTSSKTPKQPTGVHQQFNSASSFFPSPSSNESGGSNNLKKGEGSMSRSKRNNPNRNSLNTLLDSKDDNYIGGRDNYLVSSGKVYNNKNSFRFQSASQTSLFSNNNNNNAAGNKQTPPALPPCSSAVFPVQLHDQQLYAFNFNKNQDSGKTTNENNTQSNSNNYNNLNNPKKCRDLKKRDEHHHHHHHHHHHNHNNHEQQKTSLKKSWLNNSAPNIPGCDGSQNKDYLSPLHQPHHNPTTTTTTIISKGSINSLEEHLLVKIFSKMSTLDKLVAQFVCKKWHRTIQSSQNTYLLFNKIEINGQTDVSFMNVRFRSATIDFMKERNHHHHQPLASQTSINFAKFFRPSASKKPSPQPPTHSSLNPSLLQQQSNEAITRCRQNTANVDQVLRFLFTRLLNKQTYPLCLCVETVIIKSSNRLTEKGVELIAAYCPELKYISLRNCPNLKNQSVQKLVEMCNNLKFIDLTGCYNVSNLIANSTTSNVISGQQQQQQAAAAAALSTNKSIFDFKFNEFCKRIVSNGQMNQQNLKAFQQQNNQPLPKEVNFNSSNYFYLNYIDLSYCLNVDDTCIRNLCKNCVFIKNLYLRRCRLVTDLSLIYIAKYCSNLRELSLCECSKITDTGIRYLADERLVLSQSPSSSSSGGAGAGPPPEANEHTSMYDWHRLNNAQKRDEQLRHAEQMKAKFHIRYLSLAKCHLVTDKSLIHLCKAGFFEQIKYLNLKGCVLITDRFMKYLTCSHILTNHLLSTNSLEFISNLNLSIPFNLRSLDMSKTLITDKTIEYLTRLVTLKPDYELSKLNLRACASVTDSGIKLLSINFRSMQNLNLVDCGRITEESLRDIKNNCRCCVIQHTVFSFC